MRIWVSSMARERLEPILTNIGDLRLGQTYVLRQGPAVATCTGRQDTFVRGRPMFYEFMDEDSAHSHMNADTVERKRVQKMTNPNDSKIRRCHVINNSRHLVRGLVPLCRSRTRLRLLGGIGLRGWIALRYALRYGGRGGRASRVLTSTR